MTKFVLFGLRLRTRRFPRALCPNLLRSPLHALLLLQICLMLLHTKSDIAEDQNMEAGESEDDWKPVRRPR